MKTHENLYHQRIRNENDTALDRALDIRKFEISLYWQRAAYFWALIAAAFAAYFSILGSEHIGNKEFLAFLIGLVGLIFTWAWFLANRGSKYWQENWENHVDLLEGGNGLYKTILYMPIEGDWIKKFVTSAAPFSVSKINQFVGLFVIGIWCALDVLAIYKDYEVKAFDTPRWIIVISLLLITFCFCILMHTRGKTDFEGKDKEIVMRWRETKIIERPPEQQSTKL
jgi:hypothetical protein